MEPSSSTGAGGGGGPAPFLLKTYDMVDDNSTDEIVSWSSNMKSFVVWNPPEFARILLPTYFKHNNFSSFIRQLNTYGFRKIDPEKWEFANEDFAKDQKHLLKNIRRRKPIHSHSNPQGSLLDPERAAFDEEIERLVREKATLEARVLGFEQQSSAAKLHLEELTQRVESMQHRQEALMSFLEKAILDCAFVERLAQKIDSMDFSAYNKKRRLPEVDHSNSVVETSFVDNHSCSRPEFGNVIHQDFSDKLRLELSPALSDGNLVSQSTQSSNEDGGSPHRKISEGDPKDTQTRTSGLLFAPETLELSDTGASYTFKMDSAFPRKEPADDTAGLHALQQNIICNDEIDCHISCHLNLTLASTPLQVNKSPYSARIPQVVEAGRSSESRFTGNGKEPEARVNLDRNLENEDKALSISQEALNNNQGPPAAPVRVNDVFWEQFLTERPGSSDNEEASSNYRANPFDEPGDMRSGHSISRNSKSMDQLSL